MCTLNEILLASVRRSVPWMENWSVEECTKDKFVLRKETLVLKYCHDTREKITTLLFSTLTEPEKKLDLLFVAFVFGVDWTTPPQGDFADGIISLSKTIETIPAVIEGNGVAVLYESGAFQLKKYADDIFLDVTQLPYDDPITKKYLKRDLSFIDDYLKTAL